MNMVLEISFCLVIFALSSFHISNATECNGCIILESKTFEKVLAKFDLMLVKFDKYSPDLIKHAAFEKVATDLSKEVGMEDMIAAHVDILNNDGMRNTELVTKYNLKTAIPMIYNALPVLVVFMKIKEEDKKSSNETHSHSIIADSQNFDADSLKRAIRAHTGIYFTLPGCIDNFDFLALKFAGETTKFKKQSVISEAETQLSQIPEAESNKVAIAKEYISWMKKAIESGKDTETFTDSTIHEIMGSKQNEALKSQALNILDAFNLAGKFQMVEAPEHDEL